MASEANCPGCGIELPKSETSQIDVLCPNCTAGQADNPAPELPATEKGKAAGPRIFLLICLLAAVIYILHAGWNNRYNQDHSDRNGKAVARILKKALEVNRKTPMMVDNSTRLDQVEVKDNTIIYKATLVTIDTETVDPKMFDKGIDTFLTEKYCSDKDARQSMELGIKYGHEYYSNNGALLYSVIVSLDNC